jgi:hypothetical protein
MPLRRTRFGHLSCLGHEQALLRALGVQGPIWPDR